MAVGRLLLRTWAERLGCSQEGPTEAPPLRTTDVGYERRQGPLVAFVVFGWCYVCLNLLVRWLRTPLFSYGMSMGEYLARPTPPVMVYRIYMCCIPVVFWAWLFYGVARRFPRLLSRPVLVL